MTDSNYHRVNISTATSPKRYNEFGDMYGEVDMILPSDLVNLNSHTIEKAEMAVMKMQVPLGKLPSATIGVTERGGPNIVITNGMIGVLPIHISQEWRSANVFENNGMETAFTDTEAVYMHAKVFRNAVRSDAIDEEVRVGHHDFQQVNDFLDFLSENLNDVLDNAVDRNRGKPPKIFFELRSDNTISLTVSPMDSNSLIMPWFCDPNVTRQGQQVVNSELKLDHEVFIYDKTADNDPSPPTYAWTEGFFIFVNEAIYKMLPSLPWYKVRKDFIPVDEFRDRYDEEFVYLLNTQTANLKVTPKQHSFYEPNAMQWERWETADFEFNFVESDAMSITSVSSIVLVMNGTAFNQQVYPVNIQNTNRSQAQTTTVPIIEVYYPLWNRPSDMTTTMVISHEDFSNAAPITINPSLLKERIIKFKLYYITVDGEMREMFIPRGAPFSFQLCFAINFIPS